MGAARRFGWRQNRRAKLAWGMWTTDATLVKLLIGRRSSTTALATTTGRWCFGAMGRSPRAALVVSSAGRSEMGGY